MMGYNVIFLVGLYAIDAIIRQVKGLSCLLYDGFWTELTFVYAELLDIATVSC